MKSFGEKFSPQRPFHLATLGRHVYPQKMSQEPIRENKEHLALQPAFWGYFKPFLKVIQTQLSHLKNVTFVRHVYHDPQKRFKDPSRNILV